MARSKRRNVFGRVFTRTDRPGFYIRFRLRGHEVERYAGPDRKTANELLGELLRKTAREDLLGERTVAAISASDLKPLFLAFLEAKHGAETIRGDERRVERIVEFFGTRPLREVTSGDVQDLLTTLKTEGLATGTRNRYLSVASLMFRFAIDKGAALDNPAKGIARPREEQRPIAFVSSADVDAILAVETDATTRAVFRVLADTGLRRGEVGRLEWRDVDLTRGIVLVRRSKIGKPREVPLTAKASEAFGVLKSLRGAVPMKGADPVFVGVRLDTLTNRFHRAAKAAGFALRLHDLRHSCASRLAQAGVPLPTVGAILGHRCWTTTARYANHVPAGAAVEAIRRLDAKPEKAADSTEIGGQAGGQRSDGDAKHVAANG